MRKDLDLKFVKRIQDALELTLEAVSMEIGPNTPEAPAASPAAQA